MIQNKAGSHLSNPLVIENTSSTEVRHSNAGTWTEPGLFLERFEVKPCPPDNERSSPYEFDSLSVPQYLRKKKWRPRYFILGNGLLTEQDLLVHELNNSAFVLPFTRLRAWVANENRTRPWGLVSRQQTTTSTHVHAVELVQNYFRFAHVQLPAVSPVARVFRAATCIPAFGRSSMGPMSTQPKEAERGLKLSFTSLVFRKTRTHRLFTSRMSFVRSVLPLFKRSARKMKT